MQQACDNNPDVPLPNYGRLGWFSDQFKSKFDSKVTIETVRKWFAGLARPRPGQMSRLAQILKVDEAWLSIGTAPEMSEKQQRVRNAAADGAVNLLAGMIQICGGHPAFPAENDPRAGEKIDLYAIIRGAQYAIHVVMGERAGDDWHFTVPVEAINTLVIGVMRVGDLSFELVELDAEGLEKGTRRRGAIEVILGTEPGPHEWRKISTFSERL